MCLVFVSILAISLIAAFARPDCIPTSPEGSTTVSPPTVTPPTTPEGEPFPWDDIRLPTTLLPSRYSLLMQPNLTLFSVVGQVTIELTALEETSFIVLHCRNMSITDNALNTLDGSVNISVGKILFYPQRDQMYLALNEPLIQGNNYSLSLKFTYTLREALEGFYLSHYLLPTGQKRYLATTQFEPNAARAAFPCLDEPQLKATFTLSVVRHERHTVLFNTPRRRTVDLGFYLGAGIKRDDFFETVKMSTYLVAFIISDYTHISASAANDVVISVWAPPHLVQQGQFALGIAVSCLNFYTNYFQIPYELPKLDLVAVPDFGAGAMENWGLTTFRDTSLLYSPQSSSGAAKQWIALVVAHELAHQWFGNLVTMRWWNDLWLNEGFATLMEFIAADSAKPEFGMPQQFIVDALMTALSLDSLHSSHPISVPVHDPDQIEAIFDAISYSKGAAVLYMLMKQIGEPVFQAGLRTYLTRHQFGNADTADLWAAIQEAADQTEADVPDIKAMMESWTLQKHYPLVTAGVSGGRLTLRQTPFLLLAGGREPDQRWFVPVTCRVSGSDRLLSAQLTNTTSPVVSLPLEGEPDWYYCNVNKTGVYRVNYPVSNWAALETLLSADTFTDLTPVDGAAILDDAFSLNRAGRLNVTVPLRLLTAALSSRAWPPLWQVAYSHVTQWLQLVFGTPAHRQLQQHVRRLISDRYSQLGWTDTGEHTIRQHRVLVLTWAVLVRLPEAVQRAWTLFNDWKVANLPMAPNFQQLVYATGVEFGSTSDWEYVWNSYLNSSVPSEKKSLLMALGWSQDPLIIENLLRQSLEGERIRPQDFIHVVQSLSANQASRLRLWRFLRIHWTEVLSKFGDGTFMIDNVIQSLVSGFNTQLELEEARTFFEGKELRSAERSLQQALESVQLNIRWRRAHQATLVSWLAAQQQR